MRTKVGVIGFSPGNGHPLSFSAIINGYDREAFEATGWLGILTYLDKKDVADFGVGNLTVAAIWTEDYDLSVSIANATKIGFVCKHVDEMLDKVDAVIIARDDWVCHFTLAMRFLERGIPVFVDKPLSLCAEQLKSFKPYLEQGLLTSCAGLRYAAELDEFRSVLRDNVPKLISGVVVHDWDKYGVHILDGIFSATKFDVVSVVSLGSDPRTVALERKDGSQILISCLGDAAKTFNFSYYSDNCRGTYEVTDNFSAFKRLLKNFERTIIDRKPAIEADLTLNIMRTLIAGNISQSEGRKVYIHEVTI